MKMSTVNTIISCIFAVLLSPQFAAAQGAHPAKPIKELIAELKSSTDTAKKSEALNLLRRSAPETNQDKDQIIELIEDNDVDIKCAAMEVMGKVKERKAVKKMIPNLKNKDSKVRIMAAVTLGEIGDERALDAMMEDSELMVLEFGQCPTAKMGAAALPKLSALVSKRGNRDRRSRKAAVCISQIKDEKAVPDLMKMLKESDDDTRVAAVGALAGMNIKLAEPEFERMLKDKDFLVRAIVINQLLESNRQLYLPKAMTMLDEDESASVISEIIGKLSESKDTSLIPKFEALLKRGGDVGRSASIALHRITGKVYKYPKGKAIEDEELRQMRFIYDGLQRFRHAKTNNEKEKDEIVKRHGIEYYDWLVKNYYDWDSERVSLTDKLNAARSSGYLLDFNNIDELLMELDKNPQQYEWK